MSGELKVAGHAWQGTCFSSSGKYGNCECGKVNLMTYSQHQAHLASLAPPAPEPTQGGPCLYAIFRNGKWWDGEYSVYGNKTECQDVVRELNSTQPAGVEDKYETVTLYPAPAPDAEKLRELVAHWRREPLAALLEQRDAQVWAEAQQAMRDMGFQHPDDVAKMILSAHAEAIERAAQHVHSRAEAHRKGISPDKGERFNRGMADICEALDMIADHIRTLSRDPHRSSAELGC